MSILNVYINKTPVNYEVKQIGEILRKENAKVILGDFNINPDIDESFEKINNLSSIIKMTQVNRESTRHNRTLDLIFQNKMKELDFFPFVYRNQYSDHDAIGFRYCKDGQISDEYEEIEIRNQKKPFLRKKTNDEMESENDFTSRKNKNSKTKKKHGADATFHEENESDRIIMECPRDTVRLSNLRKLIIGEWIDSQTINCYLYLIEKKYEKVYTMDTFFNIQLETRNFNHIDKQFSKTNLFDYELWIIPVNCTRRHWFLVTVDTKQINEKIIKINIYDSLGELKIWKNVFEERKLKMFIHYKYQQKYQLAQSPLDISTYDLYENVTR